MAVATAQDQGHPLFNTLDRPVESRPGSTRCRLRPRRPIPNRYSGLLQLWNNVLKDLVQKWKALSKEQKDWWEENKPERYPNGFSWFMAYHLSGAASAGPWTVGSTAVGGLDYILSPEIHRPWTVGLSEVGGANPIEAKIVWGDWTVGYSEVGGVSRIVPGPEFIPWTVGYSTVGSHSQVN